ncbi:putative amidase substrates transport protein [Arthrobacter globiformis NBRC 12137]|uniref:Putative amidase substrates transport protein n=1 Tax=Arthrobacter globiformis (strain ATCC 8010 / DSM 20124 / JCM 1332 / NBRC 12137 / NCIMB 8907 / NRRL B-2979 / 168) TaxID=1077972 RepID=H0QJ63_ARTG1|nr:AmiS/UreI family transporter [Arthrobacter globiformis]GAB12864.1 putative amidase substrates transport protein [Arthrobacter globiformis NBRC 12137]
MAYVCLLLSGAALLISGLATLGALPRRDAAVLSLVIGSIQLLLGITYLAVTYLGNVRLDSTAPDADGGVQLLLSASGMFLFGLTYVYVGLDFLLGLGSRGLGWFCGMVAGCGLLLAAAWFPEDPLLAALWLCWSYLWMLFFFSLALDYSRLSPLIGWSLVLASQATATVPALLGISGKWPEDPATAGGAAACIAALLLLAGGMARRDGRRNRRLAVVVSNEPLAADEPLVGGGGSLIGKRGI